MIMWKYNGRTKYLYQQNENNSTPALSDQHMEVILRSSPHSYTIF